MKFMGNKCSDRSMGSENLADRRQTDGRTHCLVGKFLNMMSLALTFSSRSQHGSITPTLIATAPSVWTFYAHNGPQHSPYQR